MYLNSKGENKSKPTSEGVPDSWLDSTLHKQDVGIIGNFINYDLGVGSAN